MSILDNIKSVAKYESKLLMRSWFYRLFLIMAVLFICVYNFNALINSDGTNWIMKALPSNIPYINLLFLNTGQAIIAVFLSSEFLKADKKLDTSEVFYVHPLSNAEYVVGKIWGNLYVFIRLNLLIIAIVVLFNLASGIPIDWLAYIIYFFVISIPTLIYIFGLSVALMLILKNQAITFVILLGYIGITVFYLKAKFYYLFDYMVYNLPLVKSTMIGFSNWGVLLNHRFIYLALGLGFLGVSIALFRRLPNSKISSQRWLVLSVALFIAAGVAAFNHVNTILRESSIREQFTKINNKYVHTPKMVINDYDITVEQHPESVSAEVLMNGEALDRASVFTFCLNPGLIVSEISEDGKKLSYKREKQIILVDFGREIDKGESTSFSMKYSGRIDGRFCFLDIPAELLQQDYTVSDMFKIDKQYFFQTKNYVLFTPETYWYPRPGTSYSNENPDWQQAYFSNFKLTVKTLDGLQAISQGALLFPEERNIVPSKLPVKKTNLSDKIKEKTAQNQTANAGAQGGNQQGGGGQRGGGGPGGQFQDRGGPGGQFQDRGGQRGGQPDSTRRQRGGQIDSARMQEFRRMREEGGQIDSTRMQEFRRMREEGGGMQGRGGGPQDSARMQEFRRMREDGGGMQGRGGGPQDSARMQEFRRMREDGGGMQGRCGGPQDSARMQEFRRMREERGGMQERGGGTQDENTSLTLVDSLFIFKTDYPTPSLTLIIGDYEQKKLTVDSTEYSVWFYRGHNHFYPVFESLVDTIPGLIRERRMSIEYQYSLDYSYKRFSVVETPVQFSSYPRTWTQAQEKMQPEMVLYPEKGCIFNEADFVTNQKNQKLNAQRNGRQISDRDAAIQSFRYFINSFSRPELAVPFSTDRGVTNITVNANPYFIFPQLYNFRYNIFSSKWPVSNRLIEIFMQNRNENDQWTRQANGISNSEKANLLLEKIPFKELLAMVEHRSLLDNIVELKARTLFAYAQESIGNRDFRDSLRAVLNRNIFSNLRFESLLDTLGTMSNVDLIKPLESWNNPVTLPIYVVGTPDVTQITNRDIQVYVIKLYITNNSDAEGILNISTNAGGGGGGFQGGGGGMQMGRMASGSSVIFDPRTDRKVSFAPRETKLLASVWEDAPRNISINTMISANLPNKINIPITNIVRERNVPVITEGDYTINNYSSLVEGEVIVDNEDPYLFELSKPEIVGLLPQWLEETDNSFPYSGVTSFRPPLQWTLTTNERFYGTHVRSAYVVRNGNGNQTATWKIPVPAGGGMYELYYHLTRAIDGRGDRRGGDQNAGNIEYQFKVKYRVNEKDFSEESAYIYFRKVKADGWNKLGNYFLSEGDTARVTLSNNTKSKTLVVADAVKIVKRQY